ncbi:MAG: glycosyltransferase family 2 protein [Muribaculaceae bacterium]|nr:glycosyltransferase family 2 protein [Muribaculaceae bacterium]
MADRHDNSVCRLSIVVLTCNQAAFTMRLLRSMTEWLRDNPYRVEVILVDNGSVDDTVVKTNELIGREAIINLRVIEAGENLGVARGRNLGLHAARGEVLMLLDNDTVADVATFEALLEYVERNKACGIAAPALYSPDGVLQASAKPFPGLILKIAHVLRPGKELACERDELLKRHPFYVIGACQIFRRDVLERVGELDEKIFYGPEDCDFCIRVREAGYTVDYLPHLHLTHDWRRATRRSPFSRLARLHIAALLHFWHKNGWRGDDPASC